MASPSAFALFPSGTPVDATVRVPGSKSVTNRALVVAALAVGRSVIEGALIADDTEAMCEVMNALGAHVDTDNEGRTLTVDGCAGRVRPHDEVLNCRSAGTVARFVPPVLALGSGDYLLDGSEQIRARPLSDLLTTLVALGIQVEYLEANGRLPVRVRGCSGRVGSVAGIAGSTTSQYTSGLMLSAPCFEHGLTLTIAGEPVSQPYLDLTIEVMRAFGATVEREGSRRLCIPAGGYRATKYTIEPDASSASYFFAAAAISGGRVTVAGLGSSSRQGDLGFVSALERMGCTMNIRLDSTELIGPAQLDGIDIDMRDISDMVPSLAAVAPFASTPTRIRGVGFIRGKESDRIGAVVCELRRAGIETVEESDGLTIHPGRPQACRIRTYDDHRIAMSFALLGLRTPNLVIEDPACVRKTYPCYFADLSAATGLAYRATA